MNITAGLMIQCFYFFLFVFAVIVLFDVLIRFKSPIQLKTYFLVLIIAVGTASFCSFMMTGPDQFIMIFWGSKIFTAISLIQIFTKIYFVNHRKIADYFCVYCLVLFCFMIFYTYGLNSEDEVFPKNNSITNVLDQREFNFNLPPYLKLFVILYFVGFNAFSIYYSYCILLLFSHNNIYFKRIQIWTTFFAIMVLVAFLAAVLNAIFNISDVNSNIASIGSILMLLLIILYRPNFINKNGSKISFGHLFNRKNYNDDINDIDFNFHFYNNLYYKNNTANINDFSRKIGVPKEVLANYINFTYSMSFDELINKSRVEYFVEIIKLPEFKNFTIEALALEVGFNSRQRFYQPFKKYHGGNPSDLIYTLFD